MPVSYHFEGRIFHLATVGVSTVDELLATFNAALEDPNFPERAILLWDTSKSATLKERTPEEIRKIAKILGPKSARHSKCTAIVASSDLYYGLMRMASAYGDEFETNTQVFRTLPEAQEWIRSYELEKSD